MKDAFDNYLVHGRRDAVNPARFGTKAAAHYLRQVPAGESAVIRLRLRPAAIAPRALSEEFDATFHLRQREADAFYHRITPFPLSDDMRNVQRQAFAGMLWSKQYYRYMVNRWLDGDKAGTPPPEERKKGRNRNWRHFAAGDVLSMPDKWEYPWFAAWDTAFHCIPLAMIDPDFAKDQLLLLMREWYMHPNGQIPACEWAFGDVNPPVHAWAANRVYQIEQKMYGRRDRKFLERVFQKLLLNFTWWVNRKDAEGNNIFEGGFLGLDNISAFDRTKGLADRREARTGGWHELDGDVLPQHAEHRARTRQGGRRLPGHRDQVLRALRVHRRSGEPNGRAAERPVGRERRVLLRCAEVPRRPLRENRRAIDRGTDSPLRHRRRRP